GEAYEGQDRDAARRLGGSGRGIEPRGRRDYRGRFEDTGWQRRQRPRSGGRLTMGLSDLCIRRPVFATVLSLVVVLVGFVSFSRLTVREYPNIDPPVVLVQTVYRGASAEVIESTVTRVLEESISGIEGIDYLRSTTRQESSQVVVRFKLGR